MVERCHASFQALCRQLGKPHMALQLKLPVSHRETSTGSKNSSNMNSNTVSNVGMLPKRDAVLENRTHMRRMVFSSCAIQTTLLWSKHCRPQAISALCLTKASWSVVAVHGLFGDCRSNWAAPGQCTPWLAQDEYWTDDNLAHARVFSFGYDVSHAFGPLATAIYEATAALLSALRGMRRATRTHDRPIVFIAHDVGGILVKAAINHAHAKDDHFGSILDAVKGIVFLGTPHIDIEHLRSRLLSVYPALIHDVSWDGEMIDAFEKNASPLQLVADAFDSRTPRIRIRSFWETVQLHNTWVSTSRALCP